VIRLRVEDAAGTRVVELDGERVTLGRGDDCDVMLDDPGVSRHHAELRREGGAWVLRDLGSSNGTFVRGAPVSRHTLAPGEPVRLGPDASVELLAGDATAREEEAWDEPAVETTSERRPPRGRAAPARVERGRAAPRAAAGPLAWFRRVTWTLEPRAAHGGTRVLRASATPVGRDPSAGLVLDDESVSRMHARLDAGDGRLAVTDLKSRNGTFVNDRPVLQSDLAPGDEVRFGDVAFVVGRHAGPAWGRIAAVAGALAAVVVATLTVQAVGRAIAERTAVAEAGRRLRAQVVENVRSGIAASRGGDAEMAREYLLHAADLMLLSDLAPGGVSLERPADFFRPIVPELPAEEREFDFASALDPSVVETSRARLATLTNREYVEHQLRRYAIELNQSPDVPSGFVERVWHFVQEYERYPAGMRTMMRRARDIHPRLRTILASRHLPESFCYVAWVESGLEPQALSGVGARGLWQLMPGTARERGLRVPPPGGTGPDDRTDVERSTLAAADYIATLLRDQGPEYFMLVLASYNTGPARIDRFKQRIRDPMLPATQRFWYLVEHTDLSRETRDYVPRIFAVRLVAEAPERFGFEPW
jgi:pSer/pThr/pTyr-binding forkhead associated (FHA) protein